MFMRRHIIGRIRLAIESTGVAKLYKSLPNFRYSTFVLCHRHFCAMEGMGLASSAIFAKRPCGTERKAELSSHPNLHGLTTQPNMLNLNVRCCLTSLARGKLLKHSDSGGVDQKSCRRQDGRTRVAAQDCCTKILNVDQSFATNTT